MSERAADPARRSAMLHAICRMCHGGCGTRIEVESGRITRVEGDPENPINRGKLCSKAGAPSVEQSYHRERIEYPLLRTSREVPFARASWDEAIAFLADRMLAIRASFGAEAIVFARGVSMNNNQVLTRLANAFGTPNAISINYYCYGPRIAACAATSAGKFSARTWDTVSIVDYYNHPACIVEWGSQKRISNDHGLIGHAPVTEALRRNPVNILVDPRRPASAGKEDIWLPLRPGTDAAMALGWLHVILAENLEDRDFVRDHCHGIEALRERVRDYPPDRVAAITGCRAEDIRAAARLYARVKPAAIAWGTGLDHIGKNTFQAARAVHILMGITGNLDVPGGNCFWPTPALGECELWELLPPEQDEKRIGADRFPGLNQRPTIYAHPPSVFQAILSDDPYPVKGMVVVGNNPAVCYPNTRRVMEALRKLELLAVSDIFMTPTARAAHVVFPAASNLERDEPRLYMNIKGPGGMFMDTSTRKVVSAGERRSDWDFLFELGRALGYERYFPSIEEFVAEALAPMGLSWRELRERDYVVVPLTFRKYEKSGFGTPTGKFELWSTVAEAWGLDPLPGHVEPDESPASTPELSSQYPLILNTGVRQPMYWNSNGHPLSSLRRLQPEPLLEIHPATAARFGLADKGHAWVETRRGRLRYRVRCTSRTREDVVSVPHGWWQPRSAEDAAGVFDVCSNVLTDDCPDACDRVLGSSPLKALLCRVYPADVSEVA
jgi:anaerobic selenocysteine-containing dehydrogenase